MTKTRRTAIVYQHNPKKRFSCFSKRRGGFFKKSEAIEKMTGCRVAVLMKTESGNVFRYSSCDATKKLLAELADSFPDTLDHDSSHQRDDTDPQQSPIMDPIKTVIEMKRNSPQCHSGLDPDGKQSAHSLPSLTAKRNHALPSKTAEKQLQKSKSGSLRNIELHSGNAAYTLNSAAQLHHYDFPTVPSQCDEKSPTPDFLVGAGDDQSIDSADRCNLSCNLPSDRDFAALNHVYPSSMSTPPRSAATHCYQEDPTCFNSSTRKKRTSSKPDNGSHKRALFQPHHYSGATVNYSSQEWSSASFSPFPFMQPQMQQAFMQAFWNEKKLVHQQQSLQFQKFVLDSRSNPQQLARRPRLLPLCNMNDILKLWDESTMYCE